MVCKIIISFYTCKFSLLSYILSLHIFVIFVLFFIYIDFCLIVKLFVIFNFFEFCSQSFNSIVVVVAYNHFLDSISSCLVHSCSIVQVIVSFFKSKFSLFLFALNLHSLLL
jgi:hypothetical protein